MRHYFYIPEDIAAAEAAAGRGSAGALEQEQERADVAKKPNSGIIFPARQEDLEGRSGSILVEDRHDAPAAATTIREADHDTVSISSRETTEEEDNYCLETSPSMDILALSCVLYTKEEEIKSLQLELEVVRRELEEQKSQDTFVESATKLEETVEEWNKELLLKQGQELVQETEISSRDRAIFRLKEDLARANRRAAELEVKLEFHDFKFASYENYLWNKNIEKNASNTTSQSHGKSYTEKLVSDLEEIEQLYLSAKQDFAAKLENLQQERNEYKAKCSLMENAVLASHLACQHSNMISEGLERADLGVPKAFMQTKMDLLESELTEQSEILVSLQAQVEELTTKLRHETKKHKQEHHILERQKLALESKVAALRKELSVHFGTGQVVVCSSAEQSFFEDATDNLLAEVSRLEARIRTKDRIISKLRAQTVEKALIEKDAIEESTAMPPAEKMPLLVVTPLPHQFSGPPARSSNSRTDRLEDEPSI